MKSLLFLLCAAVVATPAPSQPMPMNMPGMKMPAQAKSAKKRKPEKKAARPANKRAPVVRKAPAKVSAEATGTPQAVPGMAMPAQSQPSPGPHSAMPMEAGQAGQMTMPMGGHSGHEVAMSGVLGSYPMERESSGTAWQPDASEHMGLMATSGGWTLMAHGTLNFVTDHQSGPRGDEKAFASGMLMGMARRPLGNGMVQFRASLSPDPLMGARGYPLLLASGETSNGVTRLIDRQHPHDFFMELSASVSQNIGPKSSAFLYAGLPGEPAFGPPAFMHRESIMDSPEAPITHHWLDSTHITFGVLTAGVVLDRVKLEVSRFNGREPDQRRWNIETGPLDSTAVRLSWNPTRTLALQGSWGHFTDPEELEPGVDQTRWSASAMWADELAAGWKGAATLAWGRKTAHGHHDDALAAEASLKHAQWTLFGRAEMSENRELTDVEEEPAYRVGKISLGAVRDFKIADHLSAGAGALVSLNVVPVALSPLYGGSNPAGVMGFVRLRLNSLR